MLRLDLPYPPSINHYWRRVGYRTLISREGRRFRQEVVATLAAMNVQPVTGDIAVNIIVHPPDRRRRDIDNVIKALLDALEHGGAYADDSQIVDLSVKKRHPVNGGKTVVCIETVENERDVR